jgi:hypothetical protein
MTEILDSNNHRLVPEHETKSQKDDDAAKTKMMMMPQEQHQHQQPTVDDDVAVQLLEDVAVTAVVFAKSQSRDDVWRPMSW